MITLLFGGGIVVIYLLDGQIKREKKAKIALKKSIKNKMFEPRTLHPQIDESLCSGCGVCTRVCPEGDILQVINGKATLVSPIRCVGHGQCEISCPMEAIKLVFGTKTKGMDIPRLTKNYETNVPGLYIAGELGGMGLIRNAVKQGRWAARHAIKKLQSTSSSNSNLSIDCDLLIVGGGPAGLSASLYAVSKKIKYICIEQNIFGGTVSNFPKQKIVMTQPVDFPLVGEMKFSNDRISKEELLHYWNNVRRQYSLVVNENCRFEGFDFLQNGLFKVKTNQGPLITRKVILAMGVHGTPRKLGLKNEELSKVTYTLSDPEQYQGKKIVVVGGGNAAVEAACTLAKPQYSNQVILVIRGQSLDKCNEENQKKILDMMNEEYLHIWFNSSVVEIHSDYLIINKDKSVLKVKNDFLFILIGAEVPFAFLKELGVKIDKKFGVGLGEVN